MQRIDGAFKRDQSILKDMLDSPGTVQQSLRVPRLFRVLQELPFPFCTVVILKPEHVARKKRESEL